VCFGADWFARLVRCAGDRGARGLLDAHPQSVCRVDIEDPGILRDVDYPADLEAMR